MKLRNVLVSLAFTAASSIAAAEPPDGTPVREKALMLYFAKSFGGSPRRAAAPFTLGLKVRQEAPLEFGRSIDLFDLRYSGRERASLVLGGALSFDSTGDSSQDSSDQSSNVAWSMKHKGMTVTLVTLGLIGIACLAEVGICTGGGGYHESSTSTPGGG